jgi:predicted DNA-binding transcriptional regulator AlpA
VDINDSAAIASETPLDRARPKQQIRLLDYDDLIARGIKFSKPYLWKLERADRFPKRVSGGRRLAWIESEIDAHLRALVAHRDGEAA